MAVIGISVDGVDASKYFQFYTLHINWQSGSTSTAEFTLLDQLGVFRPAVGQKVEIFNGATLIWGGSFDDIKESLITIGNIATQFQCTAVAWEKRFDGLRVNQTDRPFQNRQFIADSGSSVFTTVTRFQTGFENGYPVQVRNIGGALPSGLSPATTYYIVSFTETVGSSVVTTLQLSLTAGGSPITIADDGTGVHEILWMGGSIIMAIWAQRQFATVASGYEGIALADVRPGNAIEFLPIEVATVTEILNAILAVTPGWIAYLDPSKGFHFIPKSVNLSPSNFISTGGGSDTHNIKSLTVETLRQDYVNVRLLKYSKSYVESHQFVTLPTDGVLMRFQVGSPIDSVQDLSLTPSGGGVPSHPSVGVLGEGGHDFYYRPGDDTLYQDPGGTPIGAGDTLQLDYIRFTGAFGAGLVVSEATAEIASRAVIEGNSGRYEGLSEDTSIFDSVSAQAAANTQLAVYDSIPKLVTILTNDDGILPGQTTTINFPANAVNGDFLVTQVDAYEKDGMPGTLLEYSVQASSEAIRTWFQFIQILAAGGGGGAVAASGGGGGGGGGGSNLILALTLSAATTNITSPATPADGQNLLVILTQDGSGGRQITWDMLFLYAPTEIGTLGNTVSIFPFTGHGGNWVLSGHPMTGIVP